jgi:hypothetical protein
LLFGLQRFQGLATICRNPPLAALPLQWFVCPMTTLFCWDPRYSRSGAVRTFSRTLMSRALAPCRSPFAGIVSSAHGADGSRASEFTTQERFGPDSGNLTVAV